VKRRQHPEQTSPEVGRRRFLARAGACGLATVIGARPLRAVAMPGMPAAQATPDFKPDLELELVANVDEALILPGVPTRVWRFDGRVLRGEPQALRFLPGSEYIPVIRTRRGQRVRIHFINRLPEESIVHWHGLHIPQRMDGHPMYAVGTGKRYVYEFVVDNRAGTYWFHPHPHGRTGFQVYHGLAGFLLVGDEEEDAARLPSGEHDLPLIIQDRTFDVLNRLVYLGRGMMDRMMGFLGERVLVNGSPEFERRVERTAYRLRLLNGSNSTLYRLSLSSGEPFVLIGTDGGLLEQPVVRTHLTLAIGERADVWLDFSARRPGDQVALVAESYSPTLSVVTHLQAGAPRIPGGRPIARFRVANGPARKSALAKRLSSFPPLAIEDAVNRDRPRRIRPSMMRGRAMLNGRSFDDMQGVADDEKVELGATEVWELANDASFGMPMAHPIHVHNLQFRVLDRSGGAGSNGVHQDPRAGSTDVGLKDVVLVLPGERVKVLMRFEDHTGLYLYHCHILEHEDLGMMRNYLVEASRGLRSASGDQPKRPVM
jgi:FtsP/CotA-like multicopper oxidase with cupredoxin domain